MADADQLIAECPQDREDLIVHYGADPSKITIVPCGFNPKEFYPMEKALAREMLNLNADEKIILQLGRMVPRKAQSSASMTLAERGPKRVAVRITS